jgi:malonyl-CoA/methylmalonyl-CoA synthetase
MTACLFARRHYTCGHGGNHLARNPLNDALFKPHSGSQQPFLILPDGGAISFDAFLRQAARFAHTITACGLGPGDRLAMQIHKSPEALALYAACVSAGVVSLPLNPAYTASEVGYFISDAGAKLLLCDPQNEATLRLVARNNDTKLMTLDSQGQGTFSEAAGAQSEQFETVARSPDDLAALLYTSGTTGRSKGAMLSQRNLLSNAETLRDIWQFSRNDTLLHALPVFHTHGLFVGTNICLLSGASMLFLPKFDLDNTLRLLPRATTMMGVPTYYTRLLADPRFDRQTSGHMRLFISGSAPLLADTHVQFEARTGHRILERYGMTETNMNTSNPYKGERRAGTVGLPLPGVEVKICDGNGDELPRGQTGTLEVRGPNVFQGYWQMPEKTASELRDSGWFITGDLACQDADGYVTIVGRGKDLIISGGLNIYPKEVEQVLDGLPGVLESAVIGVPHPDFGEAVVAIIIAQTGTSPDPEAIKAAAKTQLAGFKRPKSLIELPELPRNAMGKVQKAALRATYQDLFK